MLELMGISTDGHLLTLPTHTSSQNMLTCIPHLQSFTLSKSLHPFPEYAQGIGEHAEAAEPGETTRAVEEKPGAGDPELQGGGAETAQDHLPVGEGARPLHQ